MSELIFWYAIGFIFIVAIGGIIFALATKKIKLGGISGISGKGLFGWIKKPVAVQLLIGFVIWSFISWGIAVFRPDIWSMFNGVVWWAAELLPYFFFVLWTCAHYSHDHVTAIRVGACIMLLVGVYGIYHTMSKSLNNEDAQQVATARGNRQHTVTLSNDWQSFEDLNLGDSAVLFCPLGKVIIKNHGKEYTMIDGRLKNTPNPDALPTGGHAGKILFFLRAGDNTSLGRPAVIFYGPKSEILRAGGH